MDSFNNKTAVITGGASGIGFAFAKALGAEGATVIIGEPSQERLDKAVASLMELGVTAHAIVCDVALPESVEALADFAWDKAGHVDLVFNNAGIGQPRKSVTDLDVADARRVFDVNFFGVWHGCATFGKRLVEQGTEAAIYNTASENAFFTAAPGMSAYVATKHAVMGLTEAFREEMPEYVKVGSIFPGFVSTELTSGFGQFAMDADEFVSRCIPQIKAGEHFVVTHAYNLEHIDNRYNELKQAFGQYAPRYEGDDEYDVRVLLKKLSS